MNKIDLMIPIWALYNFESIKDITFKIDDSEYLKNNYTLLERNNIYNSINWAKENPNFDFKSIMKEAPVSHKLKFSNKEIFKYLMNFKEFMENDEYNLLTDDRKPKEF